MVAVPQTRDSVATEHSWPLPSPTPRPPVPAPRLPSVRADPPAVGASWKRGHRVNSVPPAFTRHESRGAVRVVARVCPRVLLRGGDTGWLPVHPRQGHVAPVKYTVVSVLHRHVPRTLLPALGGLGPGVESLGRGVLLRLTGAAGRFCPRQPLRSTSPPASARGFRLVRVFGNTIFWSCFL